EQTLLAGLLHERATHPRVGELLNELIGCDLLNDGTSPIAVNVREIRRDFDRLTRLPRAHVEEEAHLTALAQQEWAAAREASHYRSFQPWLERLIALKRREAQFLGYEKVPYD